MKEFLMLIRESVDYGNFSAEEMQEDIEKHMEWVASLADKGHFKEGNPLEAEGCCIRGKERIITDGPYIETKECISGFYFLLAHSLEEAREIAKGCPSLELGAMVEIRPVMATDDEAFGG
ncbi:YciI family protein [Flavobacterium cerinum]|uniref:YciI family protein n=1 Tax=Flavobacterium cerinum TaxID=2502784 RepID=A0ABY5INT6_9FLAO|nr:YciI family protein [Flavobacterium cerinum]UUC43837.1 YciI family protein [Flavobacterium cerinum]